MKVKSICILLIYCFNLIKAEGARTGCDGVDFGHGSIACRCSATFCDELHTDDPKTLKVGAYQLITSSKDGKRFEQSQGEMITNNENLEATTLTFKVNKNVTYQTVTGFGGAFTDTASIHLHNMSSFGVRDKAIQAYFSATAGIALTMARVPMASTDFSIRVYSYDDVRGDLDLEHFKLAQEDTEYKIPAIQEAMKHAKDIKFFGSAWSGPGWMKIDDTMIWGGKLLGKAGGKYHQAWAKYFVKFIDAYKEHDINMWGVTAENEPMEGLVPGYPFQSMGFTASMERDFIKKDLGPTLAKAHKDVKIMMLDDQRFFLKPWAETILSDPEAKKYVSGIALHWYLDKALPPDSMDFVHKKYPDVFMLGSEACGGFIFPPRGVVLGDWERGEDYSTDILQDLNHWSVGWVSWNLVLDLNGGPSWMGNKADAPIVVDHDNKVFYKQPTFYHFGHISRFVPPGSKRVSITTSSSTQLHSIAFSTPDNLNVVVILNKSEDDQLLNICDENGKCISGKSPAKSIQTYQWK